jgi:GMP synthase (glutamine-hydrolysing)
MTARLLVVQHEPDTPAAWLAEWWEAEGLVLDVVRGDLGEPLPPRVEDDGLVVLGGAMGAHDDAEHPWLTHTKALVRDAVERGIPTLGICLGHQLAAVTLGGTSERNPQGRTLGVVPVRLTAAGSEDPLLGGSEGAPAVHYNDDVVTTLPPGALVLARLPGGMPQALRLGERAWGVQFHPETPPARFEEWLRADSPDGLSPAGRSALDGVVAAEDALRAAWRPFARRFADTVRDAR